MAGGVAGDYAANNGYETETGELPLDVFLEWHPPVEDRPPTVLQVRGEGESVIAVQVAPPTAPERSWAPSYPDAVRWPIVLAAHQVAHVTGLPPVADAAPPRSWAPDYPDQHLVPTEVIPY